MATKQNRIPTDAVVSREGDLFMLIIANYWGKGETVEKAIAEVRKTSGRTRAQIERDGWCLISTEPKGYMDQMGYVCYHDNKKYTVIAEYVPNKK